MLDQVYLNNIRSLEKSYDRSIKLTFSSEIKFCET